MATGSVTTALSAADGPKFDTVTVYEVVLPAKRVVPPLVLKIRKSAASVTVPTAVAVVLPGVESATAALS